MVVYKMQVSGGYSMVFMFVQEGFGVSSHLSFALSFPHDRMERVTADETKTAKTLTINQRFDET